MTHLGAACRKPETTQIRWPFGLEDARPLPFYLYEAVERRKKSSIAETDATRQRDWLDTARAKPQQH